MWLGPLPVLQCCITCWAAMISRCARHTPRTSILVLDHHPTPMSFIQLRVELPTYSHSFSIQVPRSGAIRDVKREIFRTCPGAPRVEGQRVIWRGRLLGDDEQVMDIWKVCTYNNFDELRFTFSRSVPGTFYYHPFICST